MRGARKISWGSAIVIYHDSQDLVVVVWAPSTYPLKTRTKLYGTMDLE